MFALAAAGEAGVRKVLQMLHDEFELTMSLSGCRSLKEITSNYIMTTWDAPRVAPRLQDIRSLQCLLSVEKDNFQKLLHH